MRVAFLAYDHATHQGAFSGLAAALLKQNHDVMAFYGSGGPISGQPGIPHHVCRWWLFELDALHAFEPHRVVVFNGEFDWHHGVTAYLRQKYELRYVELGWLPQAHYNCITPRNPYSRGDLIEQTLYGLKPRRHDALLLKLMRNRYEITPRHADLPPGDFILVPLQLEYDTSIRYNSPYFKDMASFIGFVRTGFADMPVVVSSHPLEDPSRGLPEGVLRCPIRFISAAPHARAVVGINSTTTIEALMFHRAVATLGYNVGSNKGVFLEPTEAIKDIRKVLDFKPDPARVDDVVAWIRRQQYRNIRPTQWAVDAILQPIKPM